MGGTVGEASQSKKKPWKSMWGKKQAKTRKNRGNPWGDHRRSTPKQEKTMEIHGGTIGEANKSKKKPWKSMGEPIGEASTSKKKQWKSIGGP